MKVILLKDVKKLGKKYDVKDVRDGYFQNLLLPGGLAVAASKHNLDKLKASQSKIDELRKAEKERFASLLSRLSEKPIVVMVKASSKGSLFSSVKPEDIARAASVTAGSEISADAFHIEHAFDRVGEYKVKVEFDRDVKGEVRVEVKAEEG